MKGAKGFAWSVLNLPPGQLELPGPAGRLKPEDSPRPARRAGLVLEHAGRVITPSSSWKGRSSLME